MLESSRGRRVDTKLILYGIVGFLCAAQVTTLCCLASTLFRLGQASKTLVTINQDDEMVVKMAQRYDLAQAITQYDQVINAIDRYYGNQEAYPPDLQALVPEYLPRVPGIYVRAGEKMEYAPTPEQDGGAPFTFYVYGHHTGLQFMHGWELKYCPAELGFCGEADDRHYHPHRINEQWIWVNRSAL